MNTSETTPANVVDRRDFLRIAGFTIGGGLWAGCQPSKVEKAIPFLIKPEEVTPGIATWYATTCGGCSAGCGVMAKNRDGRPIKLEGIPGHPVSNGGLCPVGQAHLLELYDSHRLSQPMLNGKPGSWEDADRTIVDKLKAISLKREPIRILTGSITSPTVREEIRKFAAMYPNVRHIQYDALSSSAIADAHEKTHGVRVIPHYRFDRAEVILGFDADFLSTWISPVEFTAAYRSGRRLAAGNPKCSYHAQVESRVSLTGSNADDRFSVSPRDLRSSIRRLASLVSAKAGAGSISSAPVGPFDDSIRGLSERLWHARGQGLVVCGVNDIRSQIFVNIINHLLGNYGSTVDINRPSQQRRGNDAEVRAFAEEVKKGAVSAVLIQGVNPAYDLADGFEVGGALRELPLTVSFSNRLDETSSAAHFVCPEPHSLETWMDGEPISGVYTVTQPVIAPLRNTRPFAESLSAWTGAKKSMYDLMRQEWSRSIFRAQSRHGSFEAFWDKSVYDGYADLGVVSGGNARFRDTAFQSIHENQAPTVDAPISAVLYAKAAMLDGRHAHNPWLQELPDPVTKIVWDNYASVSPATAESLGLAEGNIVRIDGHNRSIELPVHIQPGQHDAVVAIALGYGRMGTDRFTAIGPKWLEARPTVSPGGFVGASAARFIEWSEGSLVYDGEQVTITRTSRTHPLACTQEHHSLHVPAHLDPTHGERRPIIQETTFSAYAVDPAAGSFEKHELMTMWPADHPMGEHHWGMAIDLSACTGCSACVVSCQAENNIPLVGKDEVSRNRELTWIRIDRYYDEMPGGRLTVQHQPMFCQHCANAPCETVCPVLATVHSEEGLNQQVYNRCVGTRYCSNNCPYKVRRFNWFEYDHGDAQQRLVLNPDVTVRERGVMEKCSMCVQRIQEAKIEAKKNGVPMKDGDIQPACAQSCPAQAIVFGDMNDPASRLSAHMIDPRFYRVLEETGSRPSVGYMTLVRNREQGGPAHV